MSGDRWLTSIGLAIDDPGQAAQAVLFNRRLPARFARNVEYFLLGRHFGFIPYYFPGFVAIVAWLVFRAADIFKDFAPGVAEAEARLPGAVGITADALVAGL